MLTLLFECSTGGVIALALGVKQWSVSRCIDEFTTICEQGFLERIGGGFWGREKVTSVTKYKTAPWRQALEDHLGTEALFGGAREANPTYAIKVGVTATSGTTGHTQLISNYGRPRCNPHSGSYTLVRTASPYQELGISEAAAATSAAPGYFKAFQHVATKQLYLDGALQNNNPVHVADKEWKLLWPDIADSQPDLFLSIGTGCNASIIGQDAGGPETTPDKDSR